MNALSRGMKSGRIDRLLIITDGPTAPRDERNYFHTFSRNKLHIIHSQISIDNLFQ